MNPLHLLLVAFVSAAGIATDVLGAIAKTSAKSAIGAGSKENPLPLIGCFRKFGPIDCGIAKMCANVADSFTAAFLIRRVIKKADGEANTFRHCYYTAYMVRTLGAEKALELGQMRGAIGGRKPTEIDLKNTKVSVSLGKKAKTDFEVHHACIDAIKNGDLVLVKDPPKRKKQDENNDEQGVNEEKTEETATEKGEGSTRRRRVETSVKQKDEQGDEHQEKGEQTEH